MLYLVKLTGTLRVSKEGGLEGLDIHEHGGGAIRRFSVAARLHRCRITIEMPNVAAVMCLGYVTRVRREMPKASFSLPVTAPGDRYGKTRRRTNDVAFAKGSCTLVLFEAQRVDRNEL